MSARPDSNAGSGIPPDTRPQKGKPKPDHEAEAEKSREAQEDAEARNAQASIRDHMVDIGRGNQQAGRG